jgi:hypothetical protein
MWQISVYTWSEKANFKCISGVMVSMLASIVDLTCGWVKPKTIKLVIGASLLRSSIK